MGRGELDASDGGVAVLCLDEAVGGSFMATLVRATLILGSIGFCLYSAAWFGWMTALPGANVAAQARCYWWLCAAGAVGATWVLDGVWRRVGGENRK